MQELCAHSLFLVARNPICLWWTYLFHTTSPNVDVDHAIIIFKPYWIYR